MPLRCLEGTSPVQVIFISVHNGFISLSGIRTEPTRCEEETVEMDEKGRLR
ncbi:MAG: hypothetical protein KBT08_04705 [Bacteroidales bacterium]|nr:hypothetical protein [Candidatus Cryptobacteroides onthequi]